jgi:hypothetical protein
MMRFVIPRREYEKKTGLESIGAVKEVLFFDDFKEMCRTHAKYFTRQRVLRFPEVVVFLLNMLTKSLQIELERFLAVLKGHTSSVSVTQQAFGKARKQLSAATFTR